MLEDPEVSELTRLTVNKVAREFASVVELEDVAQDAAILVATNAYTAAEKLGYGAGLFRDWLYGKLLDSYRVEMNRSSRSVSRDVLVDDLLEGGD